MNGIPNTGHSEKRLNDHEISDLNKHIAMQYGTCQHADQGRFKWTLGWSEINKFGLHDPSIRPIVVITTASYPYLPITEWYI